jgi:hypothetical protein
VQVKEVTMSKQFWVIGGEYADTRFERLVNGGAKALGPYPSYGDALEAWREISVETRPNAHMRFTIAADQPQGA